MKTQVNASLFLILSLLSCHVSQAFYPRDMNASLDSPRSSESLASPESLDSSRAPANVDQDAAKASPPLDPGLAIQQFADGKVGLGVNANLVVAALPKLEDDNRGNSSLGDQFRCHTTDTDPLLDVCADALPGSRYKLGTKAQGFRLYNGTDREKRHWEFKFPNQARQDMMFQIDDHPHISDLVIIPRKHSPFIKALENNQMEVTLPNDDKIVINRKTGKIVLGDIQENGSGLPPDLSYTGKGYLIKVQGEDGIFVGGHPFASLQTAKKALITRGGKTCSVEPSELWPNRKKINEHPKFQFSTDEAFYTWIKKHKNCQNLPKD